MNFKTSVEVKGTVQSFKFVGDPSFVFNGRIAVGALSDYKSICKASVSTTFEASSFYISYKFSDYNANHCGDIADAFGIANAIAVLTSTVTIRVDTRSFTTAMAINQNILQYNTHYDLEISDMQTVTVDGVDYITQKVVDPSYPGMEPLYCLSDGWCLVRVGNYLALPVFDHWGDKVGINSAPCSW